MIARLSTFVTKCRQRGVRYPGQLLLHYAGRQRYRLARRLGATERSFATALRHARMPDGDALVDLLRRRARPAFHFGPDDVGPLARAVPADVRESVIATAADAVARRFRFRGRPAVTFPGAVEWRAHPVGSISWQWDLNRHRYFVDLAMAHHLTGNPAYLRALSELWTSWLRANPPGEGPGWRFPFEVAARLNNWLWAFFLALYAPAGATLPLGSFARGLHDHARYLHSNLEYHWPNNHLLLEAKAVFMFAALFPDLDPGRRLGRRASRVLWHEAATQILPDGVHSELCSMYHRIVAGELWEVLQLCRRNRLPMPAGFPDQVAGMGRFSAALRRGDGSMPLLGESAEDDVYIRFDPSGVAKTSLDYWLGADSLPRSTRENLQREAPGLQVFPDAGYAFIADGHGDHEAHVTFDCGEFIRNPAPDHGHCDALGFELFAGGRRLIVDPGVYYAPDDQTRWRHGFGSTAGHNTLRVDGREQSTRGAYARVKLLGHDRSAADATIRASVEPHWAAPGGLRHLRTLRYRRPGALHVGDRIEGTGRHTLEWFFHLAPDLSADVDANGVLSAVDGNGVEQLTLRCSASPQPALTIVRGQETPLLGWVSTDSATAEPASVAVYRLETTLPFACDFSIAVLDHGR